MSEGDVLVIKGRVLSRSGEPRFRVASFVFQETAHDTGDKTTRPAERIDVDVDLVTGRFRTEIHTSADGGGWVGKLVLVDFDGKPLTDYRTLPAAGEVDWFECASAKNIDAVSWPTDETPILVSDYNKPGGPLQLTTDGTIDDSHIPPDFLRIDDPRLGEIGLNLANYVTKVYYEADQIARRSISRDFQNTTTWEFEHGLPYKPLVECIETDGSVLIGAVSHPPGTAKVVVEWDAPTTGTMIVR